MTERSWTEYFRVITPALLSIGLFMIGNLIATTNKIDDKLFKHLTNDEIHAPRSMFVSRGEQDIINRIREDQFKKIDDKLCRIEAALFKAK